MKFRPKSAPNRSAYAGNVYTLSKKPKHLRVFVLLGSCLFAIILIGQLLFVSTVTAADEILDATPLWGSADIYDTIDVAVGDYDGDGDLDIAAANLNAPTLIYRNEGDFQFTSIVIDAQTHDSMSIAWADYDGDGDLDLAVGNYNAHNQIMRNDGNDQFTIMRIGDDVRPTRSIAWGDYNGDGWLDLAIGNGENYKGAPETVADTKTLVNQLFRNNANGTFKEIENGLGGAAEATTSVTWGDYDNNGMLDLAVGNFEEHNYILKNEGGATLTEKGPSISEAKMWTQSVAWGDYDGDGYLDLAVGNGHFFSDSGKSTGDLEIYRNQLDRGSPSFERVYTQPSGRTYGVAWGDFDNDGILELARAHNNGNYEHLFFWGEENSFTRKQVGMNAHSTNVVAWADFNQDGALDLFVGKFEANQIYANHSSIFREMDTGELSEASQSVVWGDLDRDGDLDYVVGNGNYDVSSSEKSSFAYPTRLQNYAYFNRGNNNFDKRLLGDDQSDTTALAFGDCDNNGQLDLVVANDKGDDLLYKNFQGVELPQPQILPTNTVYSRSHSVAWGDYNNDGQLDLAIGKMGQSIVFANQGDCTFVDNHAVEFENVGRAEGVAWADYDNDGDLDLAIGNSNLPIQIYRFDAAENNFVEIGYLSDLPAQQTHSIAWADYDADGDLDLAVGNFKGTTQLLRNDGGDRFSFVRLSSQSNRTQAVAWGDYDNDGDPDLAVANSANDNTFLYINQGDGQFDALSLGVPEAHSLAWGDYDGDGDLDLILGRYIYDRRLSGKPVTKNKILINQLHSSADLQRNDEPTIIVQRPIANAVAADYVPTAIVSGTIIAIPFTLTLHSETARVAAVTGSYSLNGGGRWEPAVSKSIKDTWDLLAGRHIFEWDTFQSNFFGQSDNVIFRLEAHTASSPLSNIPTNTIRYISTTVGTFQRPSPSDVTDPFRVRGTQIRVLSGTQPASDALIYQLREGNSTALLMGSPVTGVPFTTRPDGYLGGRGDVREGDRLFAALPVSQGYRIPPHLIFADDSAALTADQLQGVPDELSEISAEMWLHPTSESADLLTLGDQISLTYRTVSDTTTISLTIAGETLATNQVLLTNGDSHHLAFQWSSEPLSNTILYADGVPVITGTLAQGETITPNVQLTVAHGYEGTIDEVRLWGVAREPSTSLIFDEAAPFMTSGNTFSQTIQTEDLIGYWPVTEEDGQSVIDYSGRQNHLAIANGVAVGFKPLYTLYHTSGSITNTNGPFSQNGVEMTLVSASGGVQQLTVSAENPLLLFDLDVSLEWDARNDVLFVQQLGQSFQEASALLYDITDGQVALGQLNLFHDKAFWGSADVVIRADNSLRPSAAIGGVVNYPVDDPGSKDKAPYPDAYHPGQIEMGTSWDPYGENTADLGEDWTRALAHELAHYLLFLPDNYLGMKNQILQRVECPNSFMTTTSNPGVSELLRANGWQKGECKQTIAQTLTGRNDWETVAAFYSMLRDPDVHMAFDGPSDLPLAVTYVVPWAVSDDDTLPFADRNFDVRDENGEQLLRLPNAQVYLFKAYDEADQSDDVLIPLGSPTGGGNRIKVRGAEAGDRLCLIDDAYYGCIDPISRNTVNINVAERPTGVWSPDISAESSNGRVVTVTVNQQLLPTQTLSVQLFPAHYGSVAGNAPSMQLTPAPSTSHTAVLTMTLPAYEVAIRVWMTSTASNEIERETIAIQHMNPTDWEATHTSDNRTIRLDYSPIVAGPNGSIIGNPNGSIIGNPNGSIIGNPNGSIIGNPNGSIIGNPNGSIIGNPNGSIIGNGGRVALAPISSADAQFTIYNANSLFDENGVKSVQATASIPCDKPWFVSVGQAYRVQLEKGPDKLNLPRFMAFNYLQRDVPPGYEHTLKIYFLPAGQCDWRPITATVGLVENLVVAPIENEDGTYALFSAIPIPLRQGWNLFSYPLLGSRSVSATLASIAGQYDASSVMEDSIFNQVFVTARALNIRSTPGTRLAPIAGLLLKEGDKVTVLGQERGWWQIICPTDTVESTCWISTRYTTFSDSAINGERSPIEMFEFGKTYGVYVTASSPITVSLAPPVRQPDGTLGP